MSLVQTQDVQNAFELAIQKEGQEYGLICGTRTEQLSMGWDY